jgi:dTDP-4-amino-4,6-dideoxygalactose transaminase
VTVPTAVPFNRPDVGGRELEHMREAVERGHTSADGEFSALAAATIAEEVGAPLVLLTTSCTAALEMAGMLLEIGPGDTIVVPAFGFVTTALAYARQGARILFCDIEPLTLGLDPEHLASLMDDSVRAVVPIHYSGIGCDVDGIRRVLARWPAADLVEDNAHGLFGRYRDQPLGSFGRFAALSFHETKTFICGEGGALIVNDPADIDRARVIYHKGTDRHAFLLGEVEEYTWQDVGSSFGLSDVLAAFLHGQLERRDAILARRRQVFDRYLERLAPHADRLGLRLPEVPADRRQAYSAFHLLVEDRERRDQLLATMQSAGIQATFHYVPLHRSPGGLRVSLTPTECPVTDDISGRLLRLPFFTTLADDDIDRVVACLLAAASAG